MREIAAHVKRIGMVPQIVRARVAREKALAQALSTSALDQHGFN
jgi:hypothetical protein